MVNNFCFNCFEICWLHNVYVGCKKIERLEQRTDEGITSETCVSKVQAMRSVYVSDTMEKCRNCCGEYYAMCDRYKPVRVTGIPIRKGEVIYYGKKV